MVEIIDIMQKSLQNIIPDYQLGPQIGLGRHSTVYEATHLPSGKCFVAKILKSAESAQEEALVFQEHIRWNLKPYTQLDHANILQLQEMPEAEVVCLISELAEGPSLESLLATSSLSVLQVLYIALQVISALSTAHDKALFHGNLRPSNIFVAPEKNWRTQVSDFGLFLLIDAQQAAFPSKAELNFLTYLAPEQIQLPIRVDHRTDIYAVGLFLYELLVGEVPFHDKAIPNLLMRITSEPPMPLLEKRAELPVELEQIVLKCLQKDRNQRYHHINQLAVALEELYRHLGGDSEMPLTECGDEASESGEAPCLIRWNSDHSYQIYRLPKRAGFIIGRSNEADIRLIADQDLEVSRRHAQIDYEGGHFYIRDLGSQNGVFVNKNKLEPHIQLQLNPSDHLQIGKNVFQFKHVLLNALIDAPPELFEPENEQT